MADIPPSVKGMNDLLPPEISKSQFLEEKARSVLEAFAYGEIRTPILEYTPLFVRSVGEVTDVVEKQMYTFDDNDGRSVSMRPEGTASSVRAYIEHSRWHQEPVTRWYYIGPMFRHEASQRGRLRQFHQVGAELFGIAEPTADAEVIGMLFNLLGELGLRGGDLDVTVNTLGEPEERQSYRQALVAHFSKHKDQLDEDSQRRLDTNPLRILDSKDERTQAAVAGAPLLMDVLGEGSRARFEKVREALQLLGIPHEIDPRLVRGLDYYTGTIFEIKARGGNLGAQNTICGGGRYDRLVESLGGPRTPAIGFGLGIERTLLAMPETAASFQPRLAVYFAPLDAAALAWALPVVQRLRLQGIRIEIDHRMASPKAQLKRADKTGALAAVVIGANEMAKGTVMFKLLATSEQVEIPQADLEARIHKLLD